MRGAVAAAAGLLAFPGAAAASHLDGFVYRFDEPTATTEGWCVTGTTSPSCELPFSAGDHLEENPAWSSWSDAYLGEFREQTVWFFAMDALSTDALLRKKGYLSFDLLLTGLWGGNYPGFESLFKVVANGQTLLDTSFSNDNDSLQSYPESYPQGSYPRGTGAAFVEQRPGGFSLIVYHFDLIIEYPGPYSFPNPCCADVSIAFTVSAGSTFDEFDDYPSLQPTWGIDNFVVSSTPIPEPASGVLVGLGLVALGAGRVRARRG